VLEEILQDVDQVLVMTVNPGFGHQHFIHTMLPKIRRVHQMIAESSAAAIWRSMAVSTRRLRRWWSMREPAFSSPGRRFPVIPEGGPER
jgi:hypothetical protein